MPRYNLDHLAPSMKYLTSLRPWEDIALVKQQRLSDPRWDYLWKWMIEEQGMADGGEKLRETIINYLKEHYSSQR